MFNNMGPSLADIAAVTDGNRNNNGFGSDGGWWAIIIILALCGGLNGFGGFGGGWGMNGMMGMNGFGFLNGDLWRGFDNQTVINKLDGTNSGICSLGYDQLAQMNGINSNINQMGWAIQQAVNNDTVANMQNTFTIGSKIDSCCCDNKAAIADLKNTITSMGCAVQNAMQQQTQAIIQNDNANYRQLHDEHIQELMEGYKNTIAQQAQALQFANLKASQSEQNEYLIDRLQPCAKPAYLVCNPYTNQVASYNNVGCCGQNQGCCA